MCKLIIDIGNSNVVIGYYTNHKWEKIWRLPTNKEADKLYYGYKINELLFENNVNTKDIEFIIFSSVVPQLTEIFNELLKKINPHTIHFNRTYFNQLPIEIPVQDEIGTDLVANALATHFLYKQNAIIVDFGTALTFTAVDKTGKILGVNIAPGIKTAISTLDEKTSQLDKVEIQFPEKPLGTNTQEAIQNGILIGYQGMIEKMIEVINQYLNDDFKIIFTGGLAYLFADKIKINHYEKNLTLIGLLEAGKIISNPKNN